MTHFRFVKFFFFIFVLLISAFTKLEAQQIALKTNFAYWGTTTPNMALEFALGHKTTMEIGAGYNPFTFSNNKKFKHILLQPELRYWTCESFNGHFFGLHAHGAKFNVGGLDVPVGRLTAFKDHRYQGYLYGAGLSYGYQWILNPRWNFELNLGGGYARIHYEKFPCSWCGTKEDEGDYNYWGITKASIAFVFFIK